MRTILIFAGLLTAGLCFAAPPVLDPATPVIPWYITLLSRPEIQAGIVTVLASLFAVVVAKVKLWFNAQSQEKQDEITDWENMAKELWLDAEAQTGLSAAQKLQWALNRFPGRYQKTFSAAPAAKEEQQMQLALAGLSHADSVPAAATALSLDKLAKGAAAVAVLVSCLALTGCVTTERDKQEQAAEDNIVAYAKDVGVREAAWISFYRTTMQGQADALYTDAIAAETGPDGKASARNIQACANLRMQKYALIEQQISAFLVKDAQISQNAANALSNLATLKQYFAVQGSTENLLQQSAQGAADILTQLLTKNKTASATGAPAPPAEIVPLPAKTP